MPRLSYAYRSLYRMLIASLVFAGGAILLMQAAFAQKEKPAAPVSQVKIQTDNSFRYVASNGLPKLSVKDAQKQAYIFRMPLKPSRSDSAIPFSNKYFFGVSSDGVPLEFSQDAKPDENGGFFSAPGQYAYTAIPKALLEKDLSHIGYAADGFPVFVSTKKLFKPSYNEKNEFVAGSGNLDRCNGAVVNEKHYIYVVTENYPRIPLCWRALPDESFLKSVQKVAAKNGTVKMPAPNAVTSSNPFPYMIDQNSQSLFIEENRKARSHMAYR